MRRLYSTLPVAPGITDLIEWAKEVTRERNNDYDDFNVQKSETPRIFEQPSSSADVIGTEKLGDIATGTDSGTEYLYVFVDNGGTKQWQRVALGTF